MRNIFDQYSQPENRITHALVTALHEDRRLLGYFLHELVGVKALLDKTRLSVLEQQFPGEDETDEESAERRGIPDVWIFDDEGWCVVIESKVLATVTAAQLRSHKFTATRRGFQEITVVAIAMRTPRWVPPDTRLLAW